MRYSDKAEISANYLCEIFFSETEAYKFCRATLMSRFSSSDPVGRLRRSIPVIIIKQGVPLPFHSYFLLSSFNENRGLTHFLIPCQDTDYPSLSHDSTLNIVQRYHKKIVYDQQHCTTTSVTRSILKNSSIRSYLITEKHQEYKSTKKTTVCHLHL